MASSTPSPLDGKRIVITRPDGQSAGLRDALIAQGARVIHLATIEIQPPADPAPLDAAAKRISDFDWLLFTSQNAVSAFAARLFKLAFSAGSFAGRVGCVGEATARAAMQAGFLKVRAGQGRTASDLVTELAAELKGRRVLLPRSDRADAALLEQLRALGANVTDVVAYRTLDVTAIPSILRDDVAGAHAILFFSPSAAAAFANMIKSGLLPAIAATTLVGAVGPVTHQALLAAGLRCDFEAESPSNDELLAALVARLAAGSTKNSGAHA
ncbi:MAG TPA: uroporphyrinogen-III synthase [Dongiaceae bacterium]|nr:uroporphyrinogen-III synthase [Dongiaceae bacterium]